MRNFFFLLAARTGQPVIFGNRPGASGFTAGVAPTVSGPITRTLEVPVWLAGE